MPAAPNTQWYAGTIAQAILGFETGELVYWRRWNLEDPLAAGPVIIVFNRKFDRSIRFCERMGMLSMLMPWPNAVRPKPAPSDVNEEIENAYQAYLKQHPPARRWPKHVRERLRQERFEHGPQLPEFSHASM